jgi:hypothetical protein
MKKLILFVLLFTALAVFVTGCAPFDSTVLTIPPPMADKYVVQFTSLPNNFNGQTLRAVDMEAGVVCYFVITGYGTGVSCLPLKDTTLPR